MFRVSNYKCIETANENGASLTSVSFVLLWGSDSTGLMHATPGEMKSFKSSADRIALMVAFAASSKTTPLRNGTQGLLRRR